jgi:hypothetical protein
MESIDGGLSVTHLAVLARQGRAVEAEETTIPTTEIGWSSGHVCSCVI